MAVRRRARNGRISCVDCHAPHGFVSDYWTATLTAGLAVTETIDLRSQYFYYGADTYENIFSTSQPYGAHATEHGVSLQLGYQMSHNLRWRAGFAYFTNDEKTAGGANDYDATVLTRGVDMKF